MKTIINITYQGRSANYIVDIAPHFSDGTIRKICEEAVRGGEVQGLSTNIRANAFQHYVIDRFRDEKNNQRIILRPKVPFGVC